MELWAIVVAAGSGTRFGGLKQLDPLGSKRVLDWSIEAMKCPDRTVVVVPGEHVGSLGLEQFVVVAGGATRSESVRAGLDALPASATHVVVHDGARPLVSTSVLARVVSGLAEADGAIPVVPVTDTLRRHDGSPVNRDDFVAVQTPQGFAVPVLRAGHASGDNATDDAGLVSRVGGSIVHVEGDPENLKITVPADLRLAEAILSERMRLRNTEQHETPNSKEEMSDHVTGQQDPVPFRVGQGFDVHPYSEDENRVLVLGGVAFPDAVGLVGHSDADVAAHACIDAILGAAGAGDIGTLFPDTDSSLTGANSVALLSRACVVIAEAGWIVVNIDCTVVLDTPKLAPRRAEMEQNLSEAVGAPVRIKGKRTEGVAGLAGGVQCHAVALVVQR